MKFPIIALRQQNLFVLTAFDAIPVGDGIMRERHNLRDNRICFVVDSAGTLWSFRWLRTNHTGLRRFVGHFWNVSTDEYSHAKEIDIPVSRFREIVEPHRKDVDPHAREIARSLLRAVAGCAPSDPLGRHIHLLNL